MRGDLFPELTNHPDITHNIGAIRLKLHCRQPVAVACRFFYLPRPRLELQSVSPVVDADTGLCVVPVTRLRGLFNGTGCWGSPYVRRAPLAAL